MEQQPLDTYKKLTLVRRPEDSVSYIEKDLNGSTKIVQITDLSRATSAIIPPRPKLDIPVPDITTVEDYEENVVENFKAPVGYIRNQRLSQKYDDAMIRYLADEEDDLFLTNLREKIKTLNSKQNLDLSLEAFEQIMESLERSTAFDVIVSLNRAEHIITTTPNVTWGRILSVTHIKFLCNLVYQHWVNKRCRLKKPLLRTYWPITSAHDTNPHLVFRPREKEKYRLRKKRQNDLEGYKKLVKLKNDFTQLLNICKTVQLREQLCSDMLSIQTKLFEQKMYDCTDTSGLKNELDIEKYSEKLMAPQHITLTQKRKRVNDVIVPVNDVISEPYVPSFLDHDADVNTTMNYVTDWEEMDPWWDCITHTNAQHDDKKNETPAFIHRHRIGRGGRLIIDRIPSSTWSQTHTLFPQPRPHQFNTNMHNITMGQRSAAAAKDMSVRIADINLLSGTAEDASAGAGVGVEDDVIVCLEDHIKECANADKDLTAVSAICTWLV